jgi:hypothetical protein
MMMRKILFLFLLIVPLNLTAQERIPRFEISGGYSFITLPGGTPMANYFESTTKTSHINGWMLSGSFNINRWIGLEAAYSENNGTAETLNSKGPFSSLGSSDYHIHNYLFGPRCSYRALKKVTPFIHALVGGVRQYETLRADWGIAVGGGLDVNLQKNFAIRAIQIDSLSVRSNTGLDLFARFSAGAVLKF